MKNNNLRIYISSLFIYINSKKLAFYICNVKKLEDLAKLFLLAQSCRSNRGYISSFFSFYSKVIYTCFLGPGILWWAWTILSTILNIIISTWEKKHQIKYVFVSHFLIYLHESWRVLLGKKIKIKHRNYRVYAGWCKLIKCFYNFTFW